MNVNIFDGTGMTYLLADAIVDTSVAEYGAFEGFSVLNVIDTVNENAAADLYDGFKRVEFYRLCAEVFRKRAVSMPKPLVVIFRQAADVVQDMYRKELVQDG